MDEIDRFVQRELELKETLPFGDWLRHIKQSHVDLLRLLRDGPKREGALSVEVFHRDAIGRPKCSVYALPQGCQRVLVDPDREAGIVWGLENTNSPNVPRAVEARLVREWDGIPRASIATG